MLLVQLRFLINLKINIITDNSQPRGYGAINNPHHHDREEFPPRPPSDDK